MKTLGRKVKNRACQEMNHPILKDMKDGELECPICLVRMEHSIVLHCNHRFHLKCIMAWYDTQTHQNQTPSCPYCREEIQIELVQDQMKQQQCCCVSWYGIGKKKLIL